MCYTAACGWRYFKFLKMADPENNNETKTLWVVVLTAVTMVVEVIFGLTTKSMALLADGIHMGSHVLAIGLSWAAYIIVRWSIGLLKDPASIAECVLFIPANISKP